MAPDLSFSAAALLPEGAFLLFADAEKSPRIHLKSRSQQKVHENWCCMSAKLDRTAMISDRRSGLADHHINSVLFSQSDGDFLLNRCLQDGPMNILHDVS